MVMVLVLGNYKCYKMATKRAGFPIDDYYLPSVLQAAKVRGPLKTKGNACREFPAKQNQSGENLFDTPTKTAHNDKGLH